MEVDVFKMLRYCKISGTVISLNALRNLRPVREDKVSKKIDYFMLVVAYFFTTQVSFILE